MRDVKLALCQNKPGNEKARNVEGALEMIGRAAAGGGQLVMLPEMFFYPYELLRLPAVAEANRATLEALCRAAEKYGIYLCTGTIAVKSGGKIYNRGYLVDPQGNVILEYSKAKMFDVDLPGVKVRESGVFTPGDFFPVVSTPFGKVGMLVCFDIRFPETARRLVRQGAEIILVPAAFNTVTGPAHWHLTFRARAVESQCFVAAASPARNPASTYQAYGHSLVVDPWGRILAEAGEDEEIVYASLDSSVLEDIRNRLPLLKDLAAEF